MVTGGGTRRSLEGTLLPLAFVSCGAVALLPQASGE